MNLEHVIEAVRTKRIGPGDASDEVLADAILHHEATLRRIIAPGTRAEQHSSLVAFFNQLAEQETAP
jgi:hypothetical protein